MFDPRARPTRLIACRCIGKFLFISEFGATDCPFGRSSVHFTSQPRLVFREHLAAAQGKTEMEQIALYKGFRIRVYEDWSGLWWPRRRSRLRGGRVLAITRTPVLSTLPRPPVTQRQKPLLIS